MAYNNIASDAADGRYIIILYSSLFLYTNDAIHDVVDADREVSTHRIFILDTRACDCTARIKYKRARSMRIRI